MKLAPINLKRGHKINPTENPTNDGTVTISRLTAADIAYLAVNPEVTIALNSFPYDEAGATLNFKEVEMIMHIHKDVMFTVSF